MTMGRAFESSDEHEFSADVHEVWEAIATGPGVDGWYLGSTTIEPRLGGEVTTRMGEVAMESTVTAWDPPRRFAFKGGEDDQGRFQAYEFLIEGRHHGSTVLRLITSGFLPGDDWEDELEAMTLGGAMFFATLVARVNHFAGRPARSVLAHGPRVIDFDTTWDSLEHALGIAGRNQRGVETTFLDPDIGQVDAVVDFYSAHAIGLRSEDTLYRFVRGFGNRNVMAIHHLFDPARDGKAATDAWGAWLARNFGAAT
jgi:hypothetical protein